MTIEIKHRYDGSVLYTAEDVADLKEAVEAAARDGANLHSADLHSADLRWANLRSANLHWANLRSANLRSANLHSADNLNHHRHNDLTMLRFQTGKIRAFKMVDENLDSPIQTGNKLTYEIGSTVEADANHDDTADCRAGINLATAPWILGNFSTNRRILLVEFAAKDIAAIPTGGKFRVTRCKVVREIDPSELGINPDGTDIAPEVAEEVEVEA